MNSSHAKELKAEVKFLHKTVMSASEATKRALGLKRNAAQRAAQRATPHLAPPSEPFPQPCCTHTEQLHITFNINICGQPSHSH
ncbi:hypothetical protein EYR40_009477 [Pleurotus pulmonarius]|nr:hypothetical protein EYR40_009477 [Pleurotus pulmonarius]